MQIQKAVNDYLKSKQLLPFGFARHNTLSHKQMMLAGFWYKIILDQRGRIWFNIKIILLIFNV